MNTTSKFHTAAQKSNTVKIKALLAGLLMLVFYSQSWAVEPYDSGTSLYVTAYSGLHMRTAPDARANSVMVLSHGDRVEVLEQPDSLVAQKLDWVTGHWILVSHEGEEGYIFDGFLTPLNIPTNEWEKCQLDLDMIYPLEQWTEINHLLLKTDTVEGVYITRVTDYFEDGTKLVKTNSGDIYKIELHLKDVRMMDAYHLLQSMLDDRPRIRTFQNESIFIEEAHNTDLKRIKVKLDNPVDIRRVNEDTIKISIHSQEYPCQL